MNRQIDNRNEIDPERKPAEEQEGAKADLIVTLVSDGGRASDPEPSAKGEAEGDGKRGGGHEKEWSVDSLLRLLVHLPPLVACGIIYYFPPSKATLPRRGKIIFTNLKLSNNPIKNSNFPRNLLGTWIWQRGRIPTVGLWRFVLESRQARRRYHVADRSQDAAAEDTRRGVGDDEFRPFGSDASVWR